MKLRIKGNTLRLRLTKSEIDYFEKTNLIEEQINFNGNFLNYALKADDSASLNATFENNEIIVHMPIMLAKEWASTSLVGCNGEMRTGTTNKLFLLVEKDYKCLDETTEDQSDNFENPLASKQK